MATDQEVHELPVGTVVNVAGIPVALCAAVMAKSHRDNWALIAQLQDRDEWPGAFTGVGSVNAPGPVASDPA